MVSCITLSDRTRHGAPRRLEAGPARASARDAARAGRAAAWRNAPPRAVWRGNGVLVCSAGFGARISRTRGHLVRGQQHGPACEIERVDGAQAMRRPRRATLRPPTGGPGGKRGAAGRSCGVHDRR
ncbi:hypothetical protein L566_1601 [Bordetella pertussis CHLA-26]|uniref:Uncharacterized protein n=1 Tax=Bordetella pertussis CHLA-26 TaxID=1331284 RepID=A0AAI9NF47_BORPT|nr:hypothetical protein L566_1601 [Bordetella pertussis CHLA-26]